MGVKVLWTLFHLKQLPGFILQYYFFADMYNPKNNPFKVPLDNDIFTLRERERDAKLQVKLLEWHLKKFAKLFKNTYTTQVLSSFFLQKTWTSNSRTLWLRLILNTIFSCFKTFQISWKFAKKEQEIPAFFNLAPGFHSVWARKSACKIPASTNGTGIICVRFQTCTNDNILVLYLFPSVRIL